MSKRPRHSDIRNLDDVAAALAERTGETPEAAAESLLALDDGRKRVINELFAVIKGVDRLEAKMRTLGIPELPGGGFPLLPQSRQ